MNPTQLAKVIRWASTAALEHVQLALHAGEAPDTDGGMGLWQSFQAEFPKDAFPGTYDMAVTAYSTAYSETVRALSTLGEVKTK